MSLFLETDHKINASGSISFIIQFQTFIYNNYNSLKSPNKDAMHYEIVEFIIVSKIIISFQHSKLVTKECTQASK